MHRLTSLPGMPTPRVAGRLIGVIMACALLVLPTFGWVDDAKAANCKPKSVGGPSVGQVTVGDTRVPLKKVSFKPGGALIPPATNRAAGISTLHARIGARFGTTVIAWHVWYGRECPGTLNSLRRLPIGSTFEIQRKGGKPITLKITERVSVPRGQYLDEWFRPDGPYQVAFFTCGGLRNGVHTTNVVVIAVPVDQPDASGGEGSTP
jgi:hypothetical protein